MNFQSRALVSADLPSWYWDAGVAKTRNLGTLAGTVQLGDGSTVATLPTQNSPTHGMTLDGSSDYLLRTEATDELTFTHPASFSVEALCVRTPLQTGSYAALICKNGGGAGASAPYQLYLYNDAGTMKVGFVSLNTAAAVRGITLTALGNYWPAGMTTHVVGTCDGTTWRVIINAVQAFSAVASGCFAPDAAGSALYVGASKYGAGAIAAFFGGKIYNWAVYPFCLQLGEVAQLYRQRLAALNRGY